MFQVIRSLKRKTNKIIRYAGTNNPRHKSEQALYIEL